MPKTIAITPSWYWPGGVPRVLGVPPFDLAEQLVLRNARHSPETTALVDQEGTRLTWSQLFDAVMGAAGAISSRVGEGQVLTLCAGPSVEGAILLLASAVSGRPTRLVPPELLGHVSTAAALTLVDNARRPVAQGGATPVAGLSELGQGPSVPSADLSLPALAFTTPQGAGIWHSQRSLLAGGLSFGAFIGGDSRPTVQTEPFWSWWGVTGLVTTLSAGAPLVLSEPGEAALDCAGREGAASIAAPLSLVAGWTREAKRSVKQLRGSLSHLVLWIDGLFDADARRRVAKQFDCPALTAWGLPETGPVFASHPSWYIDESVGIPMTNAHVVPVEPRSGAPIATLWELIESARVTVYTPALALGHDAGSGSAAPQRDERYSGGRFVTGSIASSDANGMIYLLPD